MGDEPKSSAIRVCWQLSLDGEEEQEQQQHQQQQQPRQQQQILGRDEHHYLVVDTNIWLGEQLNALKKLLHDYTNPWIISVPYVVLDEIDTKKRKDKRLKIAACKAMQVLDYFCDSPRIWKQDPYLDKDANLLGNKADDQILHFCELLINSKKDTYIWTLDKGLRVKANALGVTIYQSES